MIFKVYTYIPWFTRNEGIATLAKHFFTRTLRERGSGSPSTTFMTLELSLGKISVNLVVLSYVDKQDLVTFNDEFDHDPVADIDGD